jgi:leucyl-tRNA synthetase
LPDYPFKAIEPKWQAYWAEHATFRTPNPGDPGFDPKKPKIYILDMFPYPSGDGLHVGHPEGYTATDIVARYKRMKGFNVLHPMGWDSFGLPAEQYAVKTGQHPAVTTAKNVARFKQQIQRLGFSYDWEREIATSDPAYYRWTQWLFRKFYEKGLAYQAEVPVWWCEELGTVLANEEVDAEGKSDVGGFPCVRRNMKQWMLRITAYAEPLLKDLESLDWPAGIKKMQADWIGRSEGADLDFKVSMGPAQGETLRVFTTRPDTLFGATYMVVAPEHPLLRRLTTEAQKAKVEAYVEASARKSERERQVDAKEKTGVFTGSYATNPATGEPIPIWTADYVLASYGTGAIMAVPVHDGRDFEFALAFGLPLKTVVKPAKGEPKGLKGEFEGIEYVCMTDEGVAVNSGFLDGLPTPAAKAKMLDHVEAQGFGKRVVRFKIRDWLFSRQRYWGEPFPIVYGADGSINLVAEGELPITLPEMESFKPAGGFEPPLAKVESWIQTPQGRREANTMPQWSGSCWYFMRFIDAKNPDLPWDKALADYWLPVDLYIGGAEHAVMHLLYARFWYKVFKDLGLVSGAEPFTKLFNQGMIVGTAYKTKAGSIVKTESVQWKGGRPFHPETGEELVVSQAKMSKSLGNVVNPDQIVDMYGADSLRLYEMFMGPLAESKVWDTNNINGVYRFLRRVWTLVTGGEEQGARKDLAGAADEAVEKALHRCLKQVGDDLEGLRFNTAIAAMMTLMNQVEGKPLTRGQAETLALMVAPFAPHLGEELWQRLGHAKGLAWEPWPNPDPRWLKDETLELPVQVNGKLRGLVLVPAEATAADIEKAALADPKVQAALEGRTPKKVIVVPKKLVSFVL